ncbi:MAG: DNA primase regulatory subunit PriL [Methanocalculus sp. MSAO_Arc2]|uniref:DNA primase large subunit PriL n=1 Tax=Methanocalculus sp. MSAO_Arc2 TaxID=2293855 RepID=UPI000FEEDE4F|nr:MAG: DNA primase regulatory subunit PriL [Methanocalculus sp. MSAO_Arc2]
MKIRLELQDRARYPFLKEAHEIIADRGITLQTITTQSLAETYRDAAVSRIQNAALVRDARSWTDSSDPFLDIVSYALARVLVSCIRNKNGIGLLARYEADRALYFLQVIEEREDVKNYIYQELGMPFSRTDIEYTRYIELASTLHDDRYRLVNRDLWNGRVALLSDEQDLLLRERIRMLVMDQLPLQIPESVCTKLQPAVSEVESIISERLTVEYGEVEAQRFPPCITALHEAAAEGKYLSHSGRFALTTFLHTIGMDQTEIISLFSRAGDFNLDMTTYQVDHIISHGDGGYTTPSCATMKTHGICIGKNSHCETIRHPLNYYRKQKKTGKTNRSQADPRTTAGSAENQTTRGAAKDDTSGSADK